MKSPLLYLFEMLLCSGVLMAFYRLMLVRRVSFAWCRRYLVGAVLLSVAIPSLNIPLYPADATFSGLSELFPKSLSLSATATSAESASAALLSPADRLVEAQVVVPSLESVAAESPRTAIQGVAPALERVESPRVFAGLFETVIYWLFVFYGLSVVVFFAFFAVRVVWIFRLRHTSRLTPCHDYTLAENSGIQTPFSFLRTIFLGDGFEGRRRDVVINHEASHIRHSHSAERIVVELVRCLCWFNPFVWLAARWLREVQEWEADRDVLEAGYDLSEYRTIIFYQLFGYNPDIACGLNHSLTKNRFTMMTHFKESRFALLRLCALVPILAGMIMLCSFTIRTSQPEPESATAPAEEQPVIPGLENLKPLDISLYYMILERDGDRSKFSYISYLPVDDSKYKISNDPGRPFTITDLNGKNITDWVRKHYMVKLTNPVFIIDGEKLDKEQYMAYASEQTKTEAAKSAWARRSEQLYAGAEVGKLLGDPAVDALMVITSEARIVSGFAQLPNLNCPLRCDAAIGGIGAYSLRKHAVNGVRSMHTGCDIKAAAGTPVVAAADGTVTAAGVDGGWGNCVQIAHANGYTTKYAHLATLGVKLGEQVKGGDPIGTVGATGRATGPHLHFEMARNKQPFDPAQLFDFLTGGIHPTAKRPSATVATLTAAVSSERQPVALLRISANGMTFNGTPANTANLPTKITAWRNALPESQRADALVTISVDDDTKMGTVADVKEILRKAEVTKVAYE